MINGPLNVCQNPTLSNLSICIIITFPYSQTLAALISGNQSVEFRLVDFIVSLAFIACHYSDI